VTEPVRVRPLRIVILNNDSETLKTVAHWFEINGHRVTTSALAAMRRADLEEISDFLTRHSPDVVVYDVAIPYWPNWDYLRVLRTAPDMPRIPYVVTTPNKAALTRLVGANDALELLGAPEDLTVVLRAAEAAGSERRKSERSVAAASAPPFPRAVT
jgi:CheY-like chemotaxis protein